MIYEPKATVAHYESASSTSLEKAKELIETNRRKFVEKWGGVLGRKYYRMSENVLSARLVLREPQLRVLFLSGRPGHLETEVDHRELNAIQWLVASGYHVTWMIVNAGVAKEMPAEIEILQPAAHFRATLREHLPHCDVLWIGNSELLGEMLSDSLLYITGHPPWIVYPDESGDFSII